MIFCYQGPAREAGNYMAFSRQQKLLSKYSYVCNQKNVSGCRSNFICELLIQALLLTQLKLKLNLNSQNVGLVLLHSL